MSDEKLHLTGSVSTALGGMIGGGIFAVLGVVAQITHSATWTAFLIAGLIAACASYAFNKLNALTDNQGGSVTYVYVFTMGDRLVI